ncbi:single-stranded DNA-binding protein [Hyphomicrobium sp.]|uniref:single-stranded DNA-binding protein n=1 Tax=Hyphomicrobium sp. TaxID=82 RepID=UPI002C94A16F|nr:single-stranded DNA-binding protein [Hyphomicrobium sp.]HRQ25792.1 single-stranded DNA-binding protein [Hyphomicrobium sp.]
MKETIESAFIGRLGSDAELRTSAAGKPWMKFTVAVGSDDATQWVRIAVFGAKAESLAGTLLKGDRAYIEGTLKLETWTDREGNTRSGLSVAAWKIEKIGAIGRNKPRKQKAPPEGNDPAPLSGGSSPPFEADIPF